MLLYHNLWPAGLADEWCRAAGDYMTGADRFARDLELLRADPRVAFARPHDFFAGRVDAPVAVYVTFDDGYRSSVDALRALAADGIPAAILVNSSLVGTGDLAWPEKLLAFARGRMSVARFVRLREGLKTMDTDTRESFLAQMWGVFRPGGSPFDVALQLASWDELRELAALGIDVGGHTATHPLLPRCTLARLVEEIDGDKRRIEAELGRPIDLFAIPNGDVGDCDAASEARCRAAGYRYLFSAFGGTNARADATRILRREEAGCDGVDLRLLLKELLA